MLDPLTIAASVIQKKIPSLTLPEAANIAWDVIAAIKQVNEMNAAETAGKAAT